MKSSVLRFVCFYDLILAFFWSSLFPKKWIRADLWRLLFRNVILKTLANGNSKVLAGQIAIAACLNQRSVNPSGYGIFEIVKTTFELPGFLRYNSRRNYWWSTSKRSCFYDLIYRNGGTFFIDLPLLGSIHPGIRTKNDEGSHTKKISPLA